LAQDARLLENLGTEVDALMDEKSVDLPEVTDEEWAAARAGFIKVCDTSFV
jgi:hypothetical protein